MADAIPLRKSPDLEDGEQALPGGDLPGLDIGYAFSIDERRSLSVRTTFGRGATCEVQEKILARIFNTTAVMGLREKLIEHKREQKNARRRLEELSGDPSKKKELEGEISALQVEATSFAKQAETRFRESGRTGTYSPAGADKTRIMGFGTDIEKRRKAIADLDADLERQRGELRNAIENYGVAISNVESEIAIRRESYGE